MNVFSKWFKKEEKERRDAAHVHDKEAQRSSVSEITSHNDARVKTDGNVFDEVVLSNITTEKSLSCNAKNTYVFSVAHAATKQEIASHVRKCFNVHPVAVNLVQGKAKRVRFGLRFGVRNTIKKAYVRIKKGETITLPKVETKK